MDCELTSDRFWKRVIKLENCWIWNGDIGFHHDGYVDKAHRYSYKLHYGDIPNDKIIKRSCNNKLCVNPQHLIISNSKRINKYNYNLNIFYNENSISYYLLGVYMTDGNIWSNKNTATKAVRLTSKDFDWLSNIKNIICPEIKIYMKNGAAEFGIYSTELANWLMAKGCSSQKSLTLKIPNIPKQYISDFIRGCIDGDGTLYVGKDKRGNFSYRASIVSGSLDFIQEFNKILDENNFTYNTRTVQVAKPHLMSSGKIFTPKNKYYTTTLYSKKAYEFIKWIYYPNNKLSMPRKQLLSEKIIATYDKFQNRKIHLVSS